MKININQVAMKIIVFMLFILVSISCSTGHISQNKNINIGTYVGEYNRLAFFKDSTFVLLPLEGDAYSEQ